MTFGLSGAHALMPYLQAALYGIMTLFQTPHAATPQEAERLAWFKSWIDQSAEIGAEVIRIPGDWRMLEENGDDQWSQWYVDETVELVRYAGAHNIKVIFEFAQTPDWAKTSNRDDGVWTYPRRVEDYAQAAAHLHRRFMVAGVSRHIAAWEVWNEPNVKAFWPGGAYRYPDMVGENVDIAVDEAAAREYVRLLNATYAALKGADPTVKVLGGSLAGTDFEYAGWMLEHGARFDGLAVHPYTRPYENQPTPARPKDDPVDYPEGDGESPTLNERWSFAHGIERLHRQLQEAGHGGDLWITEIGWKIKSPGGGWGYVADEQVQAQYLAEALDLVRSWDFVKAFTWFQLYDAGDGDFGLLNPDGSWRASARLYHDFMAGHSVSKDWLKDLRPQK